MSIQTANEQLMLELLNRARLDPLGEAARYGIDLNQDLAAGTISAAPKQALAMNDLLINSARSHSQWMIDVDVFSHTGINGTSPGDRMTAAGYPFTGSWMWGENIAWYGYQNISVNMTSVIYAHHEGLFKSAGHRENILEDYFREVGVGQIGGQFTSGGIAYNASMLAENFARSGSSVFLTGVVYVDNIVNDNFYSVGEGSGGLAIWANGAWRYSSSSGGYDVALSSGTHTITMGTVAYSITIGDRNAKVDLVDGTELVTDTSITLLSGSTRATLIGTASASLTGAGGAEVLTGNAGANALSGGAGNDTLIGGFGADVLTGGGGNDSLSGGDDLDVAVFIGLRSQYSIVFDNAGGATVTDNVGNRDGVDVLSGVENIRFADITLSVPNPGVNLTGGTGSDYLVGYGLDDTLVGLGGNDWLYGFAGNDWLYGGTGVDVLVGGTGSDALFGDADADYLFGGDGNDTIYGGDGVDVLNGEVGDDVMIGGAAGDYFYGGEGANWAYGGDGNDIFVGGGGGEVFIGDSGNDYVYARGGNDTIYGGADVDVLLGEGGDDVFDAGPGTDYLFLGEGGNDTVVINSQSGIQVVNDFSTTSWEDTISMTSTPQRSFADVLRSTYDYGSFCIIQVDGDTAIWLIGVTKSSLTPSDFVFG